jgi:hypothetical protein
MVKTARSPIRKSGIDIDPGRGLALRDVVQSTGTVIPHALEQSTSNEIKTRGIRIEQSQREQIVALTQILRQSTLVHGERGENLSVDAVRVETLSAMTGGNAITRPSMLADRVIGLLMGV